jgi:phage shock protein C
MSEDIKRLYRSKKDRKIFGICGGLAEYFKIDPVIVRIVAVLGLFAAGGTGWVYIIGYFIIPENDEVKL